jgi:hypothetical protein
VVALGFEAVGFGRPLAAAGLARMVELLKRLEPLANMFRRAHCPLSRAFAATTPIATAIAVKIRIKAPPKRRTKFMGY